MVIAHPRSSGPDPEPWPGRHCCMIAAVRCNPSPNKDFRAGSAVRCQQLGRRCRLLGGPRGGSTAAQKPVGIGHFQPRWMTESWVRRAQLGILGPPGSPDSQPLAGSTTPSSLSPNVQVASPSGESSVRTTTGCLLAFNSGASASVGGQCHAAERPVGSGVRVLPGAPTEVLPVQVLAPAAGQVGRLQTGRM